MRVELIPPTALLLVVGLTTPASACPVCDSETGTEVRAALVGEDLQWGLLATALPFLAVGGVVAAIHFGGGGRSDAQ
jgi:hypothetical protein